MKSFRKNYEDSKRQSTTNEQTFTSVFFFFYKVDCISVFWWTYFNITLKVPGNAAMKWNKTQKYKKKNQTNVSTRYMDQLTITTRIFSNKYMKLHTFTSLVSNYSYQLSFKSSYNDILTVVFFFNIPLFPLKKQSKPTLYVKICTWKSSQGII